MRLAERKRDKCIKKMGSSNSDTSDDCINKRIQKNNQKKNCDKHKQKMESSSSDCTIKTLDERKRHNKRKNKSGKSCKCCCCCDAGSKRRSSRSDFSVKRSSKDEDCERKKKSDKRKHCDERIHHDSKKKNCAESKKKFKSSRVDCTVQHSDEYCCCSKAKSKSGSSMSNNENNDRKKKCVKGEFSNKRKHHEKQNKNCAKFKENMESTRYDDTVHYSDRRKRHDHKKNKLATRCKNCYRPDPASKTGLSSKSKVEDCEKKNKTVEGNSAEKQILQNLCKVLGANLNDLIEDQKIVEKKLKCIREQQQNCTESNLDASSEALHSPELVQTARRYEEHRENVMNILHQLKCIMVGKENCPKNSETDIECERFEKFIKLLADYRPKGHGVRLFCSYIYTLIQKIYVL